MSTVLLRGGRIITMDPALGVLTGDVLLRDGVIAEVAPAIDASALPAGTEIVDASKHIVLPGFIDSHRHLYQSVLRGTASDWSLMQYFIGMMGRFGSVFEPEDMYVANLLGAADALDSGVTTVFDWSHNQYSPAHTDELVRGLKDSGMRAVFGYGGSMVQWEALIAPPYESDVRSDEAEIRRVRDQHFADENALVTMGLAFRGSQGSTLEACRDDWRIARELGMPINVHIGMGVHPGQEASRVAALYEAGLLGPDVILGHCNNLTAEDIAMISETGTKVSVTPEDESSMGHGWPPIATLLAAGIRPNLGTDTLMAVGGDAFTSMRFALAVTRGLANHGTIASGQEPWDLPLSTMDVLEMATIDGARVLGLESRVGSLTVGKQADVVMLRMDDVSMSPVLDPIAAVVHHASRSVVDRVYVAGNVVKKDGALVGIDTASLVDDAQRVGERLLERAGMEPRWIPTMG